MLLEERCGMKERIGLFSGVIKEGLTVVWSSLLNEVPWQVYLRTFLCIEAKGSNGASKISFI